MKILWMGIKYCTWKCNHDGINATLWEIVRNRKEVLQTAILRTNKTKRVMWTKFNPSILSFVELCNDLESFDLIAWMKTWLIHDCQPLTQESWQKWGKLEVFALAARLHTLSFKTWRAIHDFRKLFDFHTATFKYQNEIKYQRSQRCTWVKVLGLVPPTILRVRWAWGIHRKGTQVWRKKLTEVTTKWIARGASERENCAGNGTRKRPVSEKKNLQNTQKLELGKALARGYI